MKTKKAYTVPLMKNAFIEERHARAALSRFILKSKKLSMGEQCVQFEKAFAKKQGRKEAVLFSSGSGANLAMLQSLKNLGLLKDGDRVGFSALTWATNVMPILQLGLIAVPIDCDPEMLNTLSKTALPALKKERCKVFFITNVLGFAGDLDVIERECKKAGIIVLEDNCEALNTKVGKEKTGNFSLAASFSFYVAHHMSTIEGGMVCTDDHTFANILRMTRSNGWDRNLDQKSQQKLRKQHSIISEFHAKYTFYDLGYNLRPTEITGFLGLHQLKHLETITKIRENNFKRVHKVVMKNPDFLPVRHDHLKSIPAFALPFICKTASLREKYIKVFSKAGIEIRPMIAGNMHLQPFYKKYSREIFDLPGANFLHTNAFYCGNCPDYTEKELQTIIDCIKR